MSAPRASRPRIHEGRMTEVELIECLAAAVAQRVLPTRPLAINRSSAGHINFRVAAAKALRDLIPSSSTCKFL